jgi:hypothetical protein
MPNALTHYTFAKERLALTSPHLDATFVGAQGPDPFFFYGSVPFLPRRHGKTIRSLGGVTQHQEMPAPYCAMMAYANQRPDKELLYAYIDGLFMHYAVDRACHPYIFYFTGFTDRPEDSAKVHHHYNFSHMFFEVTLDFIIAHREGTFQPIADVLALSDSDLLAISKMWYEVNKEVQNVPYIAPKSFAIALKDYRLTERGAEDHSGHKKECFKRLFGKESYAYAMVFPKNLDAFKGIDFLNQAHASWRMPAGEVRNESFDDLLLEAGEIYHDLHSALLQAKDGFDVRDEVERIANHLNHEGIVPNSPKIYWKLIWPKTFLDDVIAPPAIPETQIQ